MGQEKERKVMDVGEKEQEKRSSRGIGERGIVRQVSLGEEHHSQEE